MRIVDQGELKEVEEKEYIIVSLNGKENKKGIPYYCSNIQEVKDYLTNHLEDFINKNETLTIWKEKVLSF